MSRQVRVWGWGAVTAVALLGLEGTLAAVLRAQGRLVLAPGPASLDEVVGLLAAVVALLLGAWLAVGSTAAVLAHAPGRVGAASRRLAAAWAPLLTRRVAAVLVGAAVGGALAPATASATLTQDAAPFPGFSAASAATPVSPGHVAPGGATGLTPSFSPTSPASGPPSTASEATATPAAPLPDRSTVPTAAGNRAVAAAPAVGWTPSRPPQRHVPAPDLVSSGAASGGRNEVVVHRGDTLWDLVAAHLGAGASDAEVAAAWPRWHAANRAVIGDDPDRLLPGQRLVVPSAAVAR